LQVKNVARMTEAQKQAVTLRAEAIRCGKVGGQLSTDEFQLTC
jgi:hypothetical protein